MLELEEIRHENLQKATQLRQQADMLTDFRDKSAHIIGPVMMVYGPNWPNAALTAGAIVTDYLDGKKAREAEYFGIPPTHESSEDDHLADKKLAYFGLIGALTRDLFDKHYVSAGVVGGAIAVNVARDFGMATARKQAHKEGKSTDAIFINKLKSGGIDLGILTATLPVADSKTGRIFRNGILVTSTALGLAGLKEFRKRTANTQPKA